MDNKKIKHLSKRSGFTLIEIILVVVIIGILAGIAIPRMGGKTKKALISQAKSNIAALSMAVQEYEMVNGQYPPNLASLLDESKGGPFMEKKVIPKDPWGNPYNYSAPGSHNTHTFDISCTSGDITVNNWE
ncbi:MAG TPA: type II secretion system protein GspG [Pontiella sp.]